MVACAHTEWNVRRDSTKHRSRTIPGDQDSALIERARNGDQTAFRSLFRAHRDTVFRVIHKIGGPRIDAEDLVQEVFLQVHRSLASFRGEARFSTWLYRLTANVVRMSLRKQRSRPRLVVAQEHPAHETAAAPVGCPDAQTRRAARVQALYRLLDKLSEKKREVIVMHDLEGRSASDIAELLDIPVLTVRTRLFYARKELYAALPEEPSLAEIPDLTRRPDRTTKARKTPPANKQPDNDQSPGGSA